jgi:hypothetical protein
MRGHQYVWAILVFRDHVIPWGIRLSVKAEHARALAVSFRKITELAAQLIQELQVPTGVKVIVLFDAYSRWRRVVQACRGQHFHFASTLKGNRSLFKSGWKLKVGRYGTKLFRRRRTATLVSARPHGSALPRCRWRVARGEHPRSPARRLLA